MTSDLTRLVRPFKPELVHTSPGPGGADYVGHDVVTQKLLMVSGPFTFECKQVLRGYVPEIKPNPQGSSNRAKEGRPALDNAVVGVIARLTLTVDGLRETVEEAGDCGDPHNWTHDGQRLKDAMSDAIKRCAMRFGVGLHLWAQKDWIIDPEVIDAAIAKRQGVGTSEPEPDPK